MRPTALSAWPRPVGGQRSASVRASEPGVEQKRPGWCPQTRVSGPSAVCDDALMSAATPSASSPADRRVSARVGSISESATLAVDAKAKALKAAGRPVIGFGAGEPDFPTPGYIVEAAVEACRTPKYHRYTPAGGLPELKAAIVEKTRRDSGYEIEAANVLVTNGGKQAIYEAFAAILDPGDEVIVPAPYWTTYPESIRLAGGVPVDVVADETTGYRVTVEQLEAARTDRTKVVLFVSPSNPTGAVYSREQVEAVGRWAAEHGLWVLTDEIYEHLVYGDAEFSSLPVEVPELRDKCIIVNGVAKTYAMTGWRVGWVIAPKDVIKAATNLQSHATSNVSNVAQAAAIAAVSGDLTAVDEMKVAFDRRRKKMVQMLNEIDGVVCPEPEGAFYAYPSVKGLLGKEIRGKTPQSSVELAEIILEEAEVAVVPGEAFGTPGYLRLSYALGDEDLVEGVSRLQKLLAEAK
ncbi:pyridoxal phosphate-dependent aminotransferase [Streptomyces piniterrae]|uniref:Aminotransferase n=2 Tax=Streptomyces piniterrae TaxID=2571125 RepID=A0A4U0NEI1_9ACTN|nr:pyridoxal phosphate-dependent aminotransferase [Streptomyces piniterrae]